tara:strand:- start:13 stop:762 length:750 start_codon:yes stop_codon:yes gene_type:complete
MSLNNYWTFEILPSGNFLHSVSRIPGNFSIGEDSNAMPLNFLLNSIHFANKEKSEEVYAIATFIVALINGYTKMKNIDPEEHNSVWLGNLYKNGEKVQENYKCEVDLLNIDHLLNQKPKSNELINQGFDEGLIRNILLYCNAGWNLVNMYKISDEISDFLKGKNDNISNYVKKSDYKAFGATANNYSVSGLNARHGKGKNSVPKRVMSIEEASSFIRDLIKLVFDKYFGFDIKFIPKQDKNFDFKSIEW